MALVSREPVFRARGITKIYRMGEVEVHALRGVDLELFEGELVVLLGASGSGKSTLLNILGGLDVPTSGDVVYRDHDLTARRRPGPDPLPPRARRLRLPVLQPDPQPDRAGERRAGHRDRPPSDGPARGARSWSDSSERVDHFPAQMSGGEQQRVAIARAIAKRPDVLLCDEPTGALDYTTGKIVLEVIERVNRELGTTTAVITHNAAIAAMADRVLRMRSGRITETTVNEKKVSPGEITW